MSIEEHIIFLELKVLFQRGNCFYVRRELPKILEKAEKKKVDGLKVLYEALKPEAQELHKVEPPPPSIEKSPLECTMCQKIFKNGISSWKGGKRVCKQSCTPNDLVPCQA